MNRNNFTDKDINKILSLHNDGLLHREIAVIYNTSRSSIDRVIQKSGLPSRHPMLTPERENEVLSMYSKLKSIRDVSKSLHMSKSTVRNILSKNNVYIYSNSETHQKYTLDKHYFDVIDTANKAYILGLLYADGTVNKKSGTIALSLQEEDKYILNFINDELKSNRPLTFIDYKSKNSNYKNQYRLTITNRYMHDVLVKHGLIPNKSIGCEFPVDIPEELYSNFFLGIMDGDGSISRNPKEKRCSFLGTISFCNKAKEIVENILGIHCTITYTHNPNNPTKSFQIAGGNQVKRFLDWLYGNANVFLTRKYNIYQSLYM